MNTHQRWIILPIFFLAVALRLSTITTKSLWVDEVNSLQQAGWTRAVILSNPYHDPHPPGYYLFLHEWIQRFGTSELWLRLPSAICGALSVLVVYALGRSIGSPQLGAWAAFLLAIDPIGIWYSQETRMYAMLAFFALCGTLVTALMLKRSTIWAWPIAVLTFAAAIYLDYGGLIFWGVSIVVTIIAMIWLRAWKPARFALWLTAQVAIALLYLPQWPKAFDTISSLAQGYIFQLIAEGLQRLGLKIDQQNIPIILIAVGAVMGLALLIIFIRFMRHRTGSGASSNRDNRLIIIAILIAYAAWLLLAAAPRFYSIKRVLMIYSPYVAAVAAYALTSLQRRSIVYAVVGLATASAILNWIIWPKEDWRGAASLVAQQAQAGDVIVGTPSWVASSFDYYYSSASGAAQIVSDSQLKKYPTQRVWLLIGNTYEASSRSTLRQDLTQIRQTIGQWKLYEVEVLLLQ